MSTNRWRQSDLVLEENTAAMLLYAEGTQIHRTTIHDRRPNFEQFRLFHIKLVRTAKNAHLNAHISGMRS